MCLECRLVLLIRRGSRLHHNYVGLSLRLTDDSPRIRRPSDYPGICTPGSCLASRCALRILAPCRAGRIHISMLVCSGALRLLFPCRAGRFHVCITVRTSALSVLILRRDCTHLVVHAVDIGADRLIPCPMLQNFLLQRRILTGGADGIHILIRSRLCRLEQTAHSH